MIARGLISLSAVIALQGAPVTSGPDTSNAPHAADTGQPVPSAVAPAAAQPLDTALERRARALNIQLRCPVCQSSSIQESPANQAMEMKAVVREKLAAGESEKDILAYFVSKYGEWVLLDPPKHGFNLVVYLLPLALLVGGGAFVFTTAKKWTRNA
jgi:cytochrome c-type biogenesis protein CcmH/NrfF